MAGIVDRTALSVRDPGLLNDRVHTEAAHSDPTFGLLELPNISSESGGGDWHFVEAAWVKKLTDEDLSGAPG